MADILTFDDAIKKSGESKRNLLLGNGFSIACDPNIFHYESLYQEAENRIAAEMPQAHGLFQSLGIKDFELIIKMLQHAGKVLPFYQPKNKKLVSEVDQHANKLKDILICSIAERHLERPTAISEKKYSACRKFLSHFLGADNDGRVYTLNYDLLLYWALLHDEIDGEKNHELTVNDGFGKDTPEVGYIVWVNDSYGRDQRVFYLHGAIHLFDQGDELEKYTWINERRPLIEQTREALEKNKFPLFVAEGESRQKSAKIKHHMYLSHCYKSFKQIVSQKNQSLFIFGHSLAENDDHIIKLIGKGKISKLFVSIHGDQNSNVNQSIIKKAKSFENLRNEQYPLKVDFYDAASAKVWG